MTFKIITLLALSSLCPAAIHAAPATTPPTDNAAAAAQSVDPHATETKAERDKRMGWWRKARFGMFIHWGLYAVPAGVWQGKEIGGIGEWIMNNAKIPVADYAALAPQFNPTQFNADQWVGIAKAAGMKYIVMTAKHHEGFAMFHTHTDGYNIYDATPFKRDPIEEMAAAAKKAGIKFGVYYSQAQDWHHPGGAAYGGHWDPAQDGDLHQYVRTIAAPQVTELLTKYHPAILWWDTPVDMSREDILALTAAFSKDPGLVANNRLGNGVPGDTQTPEQTIPPNGFPGKDWETCMTINDTWGYKTNDTNFKSTATLLHNLIDIASKGGNYLLNVGPEPTGVIPPPEVQRLKEMGVWLQGHGESIYGTTTGPYKRLPFDGRCTVKGDTLYLNVFTWPDAGLTLKGLLTPIKSVETLPTRQKLDVQKDADGIIHISKPDQLDTFSTTVALKLAGPPVVSEEELALVPGADGAYTLGATDATLEGSTIQVENSGGNANIGFWMNPQDAPHWKVTVPAAQAGTYSAKMEYSCQPGSEGAVLTLQVDGAPSGVTGTVQKTTGWGDYTTAALDGTLHLTAGTHIIRLMPGAKTGVAVMNLRRLMLVPAGK